MGNGQSAAAYVVLDRHVYAQGDPISGSVVFNTPKHVPFHSVNLTVRTICCMAAWLHGCTARLHGCTAARLHGMLKSMHTRRRGRAS